MKPEITALTLYYLEQLYICFIMIKGCLTGPNSSQYWFHLLRYKSSYYKYLYTTINTDILVKKEYLFTLLFKNGKKIKLCCYHHFLGFSTCFQPVFNLLLCVSVIHYTPKNNPSLFMSNSEIRTEPSASARFR